MSDEQNIIEIHHVTIAHVENIVLKDINFVVGNGEFIYLIGKTGSGKSSLLKTLYAELQACEGDVHVCGFDLQKIKRKKVSMLRRKLGIVFQDFELLSDRSVHDNLKFVMKATGWKSKADMIARSEEVLEQVGLGTKGYKMPHELSGGEQQRVAIARALLNEPELILADEPTGNLDPATTEGILQLLKDISIKGTSVIMATHDYTAIQKFQTRTVVCEDGALVEKPVHAIS